MLLLFTDGLLLFFINILLGIFIKESLSGLFHRRIISDLLGLFLTGLLFSTIYFNILSFWLPINYLSLIPLAGLSIFVLIRYRARCYELLSSITVHLTMLRNNILPTACIAFLLFIYWIKPSTSPDSRGYHFQAILWFESFKAVPGLGNLHGRFAFNPASFIIQAAYSCTGLTGQAIYPLNGVLTSLFFLWILSRLLKYKRSPSGLVYLLLLVVLFRPLLSYMSSPSSDPFVLVCIAYPVIRFFELLRAKETITLSKIIIPFLILLYAPVAKLSALPVLPLLLFIFYLLPGEEKKGALLPALFLIAGFIYLPWMGRNYLLSGYLAYPFPFPDLFHPDWKIPREMLQLDYYYARFSARSQTNTLEEFGYIQSISFGQLFFSLVIFKFKIKAYIELLLLLAGIFSPVALIIQYFKKIKPAPLPFIYLLIIYGIMWIWIYSSLDYRFGMIFLVLSFTCGLLSLAMSLEQTGKKIKIPGSLIGIVLISFTLYYSYGDYDLSREYYKNRKQPFSWKEYGILPLKDYQTYLSNGTADFPCKIDKSGAKLYQSDSLHECLNAGLPCQILYYGWEMAEVEMRGNKMDEGFRNVKVERRQ